MDEKSHIYFGKRIFIEDFKGLVPSVAINVFKFGIVEIRFFLQYSTISSEPFLKNSISGTSLPYLPASFYQFILISLTPSKKVGT
jgi:hypothetical protein